MNNGLSLNNTNDIIANSIHLIQGNVITDILDIIAQNGADTNAIITALLADQNFLNAIASAATNSYTKTESDNLFYTKTFLDNALLGKVDTSTLNTYYTKTEIDTNIYTKTNIDTNIYTKTQVNNLLITKQNIINDGDLTIAKTNGLLSALNGKVDDSQVLTNVPANAIFTDTKTQIYNANGFYDLSKIHFINGTLALESASNSPYFGSWGITINHGIANINGLQSALDLKRSISNSYSKTDIDTTFLNHYLKTESDNLFYTKTFLDNALLGKVGTGTLSSYYTKTQIDTTFTSYYTKTQIDTTFTNYYSKTYIDTNFYNKTYIDALAKPQIKYNNAYVDLDKIEFEDSTLSLGTNSNEYKITSTPLMSNVQGLTAALNLKRDISDSYTKTELDTTFLNHYLKTESDNLFYTKTFLDNALLGKVDDSQVLTNVPANATFDYPEIWTGAGNTYTRIPKLYFSNFEYPLNVGLNSADEGFGAWELKATPALADISDITVASANISFGKPLTHVLANDPGYGVEAPFQYIMTSTLAHQVSARFDNTSVHSNYIRWYVRDNNGTLQQAMQVTGAKNMNIYGNLYLGGLMYGTTAYLTGHMYGTSATFTGYVNAAGMNLQSTGDVVLTLKADTDNSGEGDNPLLRFQQDGTVVYTDMGLGEVGNTFYINWGADGTSNSQYFEIQHSGVRDFEIDRYARAKFYGQLTSTTNGDPISGERIGYTILDPAGSEIFRTDHKSHGSSDAGNYVRFYCRKATGALVNVFNIIGNKNLHCYGTITTAAGFVSTSDQSVKSDVKDIDLTPIFDNCNVKSYNRTDKPESGKRVGFIAQDIQKACTDNNLPNTFNNEIKQEDDTALLGLDYSRLVTVLWSKVKQLEQRIAVLENK